jgi:hypothetical protein
VGKDKLLPLKGSVAICSSLRFLRVLCVSAVNVFEPIFTAETGEIAETTQRKPDIKTLPTKVLTEDSHTF